MDPSRIGDKKQLLADGVFAHIGERIVNGELPPGTRIRDAELATQLHVSRTPVREALQRLERIGLVTMYPSRYTEVSSIDDDDIETARVFAAYQSGIVARLACTRLTTVDQDHVARLLDAVVASVDDDRACSANRREVFSFLSARTGNPLQHRLVDEVSLALARSLQHLRVTDAHRHGFVTACTALIQALRARDADAAERASRALHGEH